MKKRMFSWKILISVLFLIAGIGYALYVSDGYKRGRREYEVLERDFLKPAEKRQSEDNTANPEEKSLGASAEERNGDSCSTAEIIPEQKELPADAPEHGEVDWEGLIALNQDIIGWISIPAVDISYPVVQSKDNEYYLHRDINGNYLYAGSVFMDAFCDAGLSNYNTILYGHNMRDGSMFARLKDFTDPQEIQRCPYFWILSPDVDFLYEICSVHYAQPGSETFRIQFSEYEEYTVWLMNMSSLSDPPLEISLSPGDKIVTLSTCTQSEKERMTVQGKMVWKQEKE